MKSYANVRLISMFIVIVLNISTIASFIYLYVVWYIVYYSVSNRNIYYTKLKKENIIGGIWYMSRELKASTKRIKVYRQPRNKKCSNCAILEDLLIANNVEFDSINIVTPETMTEMAMHHVFPTYTPVLQVNDDIYNTELWLVRGKTLNIPEIKKLVDGSRKRWNDVGNVGECDCGVCKI